MPLAKGLWRVPGQLARPRPSAAREGAGAAPAEWGAGARCSVRAAAPPAQLADPPSLPLWSILVAPTPSLLFRLAAGCGVRRDHRGLAIGARWPWSSRVARQARGAKLELARQGVGGRAAAEPPEERAGQGGTKVMGKAWAFYCEGRELQAHFGPSWAGTRVPGAAGGQRGGEGGRRRPLTLGRGARPTGSRWAGTGALLEEAQQRGGRLLAQTRRPPPGPGER